MSDEGPRSPRAPAAGRPAPLGPTEEGVKLAAALRTAVSDQRVLDAIASVPRERFVTSSERERAYDNVALPIDCGQTISQPTVVARMLEALELQPGDRVLDVGTGSGYHAALLALLTAEVWTIERHARLSDAARRRLDELGIGNVRFYIGDGWHGLPEHAPYHAINVAAAMDDPAPAELLGQLATGGRMIAPVGVDRQHLILSRRGADGYLTERLEPVRFVALVRERRRWRANDGSREPRRPSE